LRWRFVLIRRKILGKLREKLRIEVDREKLRVLDWFERDSIWWSLGELEL
jgi:hypothetical protein